MLHWCVLGNGILVDFVGGNCCEFCESESSDFDEAVSLLVLSSILSDYICDRRRLEYDRRKRVVC